MKRAYYAMQDRKLSDLVIGYSMELKGMTSVVMKIDFDGIFIEGPCDEVDAVIARIADDEGDDPVHVEVVDAQDEDVSLSHPNLRAVGIQHEDSMMDGDWPDPEHDDHAENMDDECADDVSYSLEA